MEPMGKTYIYISPKPYALTRKVQENSLAPCFVLCFTGFRLEYYGPAALTVISPASLQPLCARED